MSGENQHDDGGSNELEILGKMEELLNGSSESEPEEHDEADFESADDDVDSDEDSGEDGDADGDAEVDESADAGHRVDKGLQKTQQRVAAMEKSLGAINSRLEQIAEAIASQGGKATKAQEKQVAELQDKADALSDDLDDDSILTGADFKSRVNKIRESLRKEVIADLEERTRKAEEQRIAQAEAERNWVDNYDPQIPELKGKGQAVLDQFKREVAKYPSHVRMNKDERDQFFAERLLIAEQVLYSKIKPDSARVPSRKPDKSTEGTRVVSTGVTATKKPSRHVDDSFADELKKMLSSGN